MIVSNTDDLTQARLPLPQFGMGQVVTLAKGAVIDPHQATAPFPDLVGLCLSVTMAVDHLAPATWGFMLLMDDPRAADVRDAIMQADHLMEGERFDASLGTLPQFGVEEPEHLIGPLGMARQVGSDFLAKACQLALLLAAVHGGASGGWNGATMVRVSGASAHDRR